MGNFKDKLARFMNGRYGADQLYYALFVFSLVLMIVNNFINSLIISILVWAFLILMVFRLLSRNIYKRRMENEKFLKIWNPVKAKGSLQIRKIREIKSHRFHKCPHCKAMLRLPRKTGKHTVDCPCCHKEFELHNIF